jgi:hypothetical protein
VGQRLGQESGRDRQRLGAAGDVAELEVDELDAGAVYLVKHRLLSGTVARQSGHRRRESHPSSPWPGRPRRRAGRLCAESKSNVP